MYGKKQKHQTDLVHLTSSPGNISNQMLDMQMLSFLHCLSVGCVLVLIKIYKNSYFPV